MRQIPPETNSKLAEFGFAGKGLVDPAETVQNAPAPWRSQKAALRHNNGEPPHLGLKFDVRYCRGIAEASDARRAPVEGSVVWRPAGRVEPARWRNHRSDLGAKARRPRHRQLELRQRPDAGQSGE